MEQWVYDVMKILAGTLITVLAYIWTSTLHSIKSDIEDIKKALTKYDKRLDDLEKFRVGITAVHNICHPDKKVNGINGTGGYVSK